MFQSFLFRFSRTKTTTWGYAYSSTHTELTQNTKTPHPSTEDGNFIRSAFCVFIFLVLFFRLKNVPNDINANIYTEI